MFLAEPPPSQADVHFSLLGFPVRIHPYFWLMVLLLRLDSSPLGLLLWAAAVLVCILLHELSHALVMRAHGMDASIVLYSFGGLAVPTARRYNARPLTPWGQILISAAGPASGFILAALLGLGLHYLGGYQVDFLEGSWRDIVPRVGLNNKVMDEFVFDLFQVSVMWGVFNLLPIFPLDGGQIALQVFTLIYPRDALRQALVLSIVVGGLMCFVAFAEWHLWFTGLLFLWLTWSNVSMLQGVR